MSGHFADWDDGTLELAVDRVTVGLDDSQLASLRSGVDSEDLLFFEQVAAAIHLGALPQLEEAPSQLVERLRNDARHWLPAEAPPAAPSFRLMTYTGWLAAAAVLLVFLFSRGAGDGASAPSLEGLVASGAPDLVRVEWSRTEDPLGERAKGEVLWSSELQQGYMVFEGLEPNDPSEAQYQLWVFDTTRADWENKPVDGGVFDVGPDGKTVVPIDPKLEVRKPGLFAVTLEVPGGVVVSEREHLVLTAAP